MVLLTRVGTGVGIGAGLGGVGVGLGVGVGWFYSSVLLDTRIRPIYPERVRAVDEDTITLAGSRLAALPGTWGLRWPEGLAVMGPVLATPRGAVIRSRLAGPAPAPGTRVVLDTVPYDPDPSAVGLAFDDVEIDTPLGPSPAWLVPAEGDTWVVMVHGRGGARREALRVLPAVHRLGLPSLVVTYRNDHGAPPSPDGCYHLGDTEWLDIEAAVRFALDRGARRVVLYGWSMGAAISGAFLDRSELASTVAAMVWDAPLVDWRATLRQQARNRRLPLWLTPLATSITSRRIGIDFDRFDLVTRPPAVRPPTLMLHGTIDTAVPVGRSRDLAAAGPAAGWQIRYVELPDVEHTAAWNADPEGYEETVATFLTEVLN